jgi:arabinofuranan 3-O-arabinosyltransferase
MDNLVRDLDPLAGRALTSTPIDVVLSRALGTQSPDDDEETGLDRNFTLPQNRTFRLYGIMRPDSAAADNTIDKLLGVSGDVVATSSSRAFNNPDVRASFAVDGNPFTAWSPADPVPGSWLQLAGRARHVTHIDVRQPTPNITHVRIYLDGRLAADTPLRQGLNRIPVPAQSASTMRLEVTARSGTGVVQVSELSFGAARMAAHPARALSGCVTVATLDGMPLRMRPVQRLAGLGPTVFTACDGPLALSVGPHRLRAVRDWMPDELVLRDGVGDVPAPTSTTAVPGTMERLSGSHWRVTATLPSGPQLLVLGQNYDPRWVASLHGRSVGRTIAADGYSAAWVVDAPGRQTFDVRFTPQRYATGALGVSAASVLVCAGIALWRRKPRPAPAEQMHSVRRQSSARRRAAAWLVIVASAWIMGGPVVAGAAVGIAAWHAWRPPPARRLLQFAVALLALVPLAFIAGNATRWGEVSAYLVWHNQWPHWFAGCSLLLLCVGVWQQDKQLTASR